MFSNNRAVNILAAARMFLFASRDVWFVVGVPVYLQSQQGWSFWQVGAFLAVWVIGYGAVQASAPNLFRRRGTGEPHRPHGHHLSHSAWPPFPALHRGRPLLVARPSAVIVVGLILFGVVFALNSAVHSFLILHYAEGDKVAMNVGFYYMANACGRLAGTVLSGALYQWQGLDACLWASAGLLLAAAPSRCCSHARSRRRPTPRRRVQRPCATESDPTTEPGVAAFGRPHRTDQALVQMRPFLLASYSR